MNNTIPAVEHALMILEYLSSGKKCASQSELQKELNFSMSSTYRILQTLLQHRWIRKNSAGTYELDNGILPLAHHFYREMATFEHAQNVLNRLTLEFDIACKISLRRGNEQVTVMRSENSGPFPLAGRVGASFPVVEGSVGAALLYREENKNILDLLEQCSVDIPEKITPSLLLNAVSEVRENGITFNLRKNRWNIAAGSIPLHDRERRVIAALTVVGNMEDFSGSNLDRIKSALHQAAEQCESI